MLKLLGAAMAVAGPSWMGLALAANLRRRPRELQQLQTALHVLRTEVDWGATPLPHALARAGECCRGPVGRLFFTAARGLATGDGRAAREIWAAAVVEVYPDLALVPADREILTALGACLGASHREDQIRHLNLCLERLAMAECEARQRAESGARLWLHMGVLSGLLLALLAL